MSGRNIWGLGSGLLLIGLGLVFLLGQFLPGNPMSILWPLFIIAAAALFFLGAAAGGKATSALVVPGSVLAMLGLIFLVQAIFGIWATWAYAWTLLIVAAGIGLSIFGVLGEVQQLRVVGRVVMLLGLVLFFVLGMFFEAIFSLSGARSLGGVLWAVLFILVGAALLLGPQRLRSIVFPIERWAGGLTGMMAEDGDAAPRSGEGWQAVSLEGGQALLPGSVRRLVFRSVGEMRVVQGEQDALVIDAPAAIRANVRARAGGDTLEIWYQADWWDWLGFGLWNAASVRYALTARSLESIRLQGMGTIKIDQMSAPQIEIIHSGAGTLTIDRLEAEELHSHMQGLGSLEIKGGRAGRQVVLQRGAGSYSAGRMASQAAEVRLQGLGSATVWVEEQLDARVDGLGSIEYYGSPRVQKTVNGLGSVNSHGER